MGFDFSLPLNTALSILILYYLKGIVFPPSSSNSVSSSDEVENDYNKSYNWRPKDHPEVVVWKRYTPRTLEEFSGKGGARILLAIKGKVFDVTRGRDFYGPDGPYGNFAGRDASRGMAKQSFDPDVLTPIDQPLDKLEDLTPSEIENMDGWIEHFTHKYIVCGELVENDDL